MKECPWCEGSLDGVPMVLGSAAVVSTRVAFTRDGSGECRAEGMGSGGHFERDGHLKLLRQCERQQEHGEHSGREREAPAGKQPCSGEVLHVVLHMNPQEDVARAEGGVGGDEEFAHGLGVLHCEEHPCHRAAARARTAAGCLPVVKALEGKGTWS